MAVHRAVRGRASGRRCLERAIGMYGHRGFRRDHDGDLVAGSFVLLGFARSGVRDPALDVPTQVWPRLVQRRRGPDGTLVRLLPDAPGGRMPEYAHRVVMDRYGGPEVLQWRAVRVVPPSAGEVRLRTVVAPVNRADLEIRSGAWPVQQADPFPYPPGLEVLGTVEAVGDGVQSVRPGRAPR